MHVCVSQGTEEKGFSAPIRSPEALGLVLRVGANDFSSLESGDWSTRPNRSRRIKR